MSGRRTIAGALKWATAIFGAATAFLVALAGFGDQVKKVWSSISWPASASDNLIVAEDGPAENFTLDPAHDDANAAVGNDDIGNTVATPTADPTELDFHGLHFEKVRAKFTVNPPDQVKELIMTPPCRCITRDDTVQIATLYNTCDGEARVGLMIYPHYPLEKQPRPLPVEDGRQIRGDTTYAGVTLPARTYVKVHYDMNELVDMQVSQCTAD